MLHTQRLEPDSGPQFATWKYVALLGAIFLVLAVALIFGMGCDGKWDCWGGTRETGKRTYKGTKGATAPQ